MVLAVQNAVDLRDLGTATGAANLFRTWISRLVPADFPDGFNPNSLQASPAIIRALPEGMRDVLVEATANALSPVFLTAALMAAAGLLVVLFLEEKPLRRQAPMSMRRFRFGVGAIR